MPQITPAFPATRLQRLASFLITLVAISLLAACGANRRHVQATNVDPAGRTPFENYCSGCHSIDGQGVPAEAPPLAGSEWVAGPEDQLIRILLHGLRGPIEVSGKTYNREMPGFGNVLTDAEIASLASYIRSRFGGQGALTEPAAVSRIRTAAQGRTNPWTADELLSNH